MVRIGVSAGQRLSGVTPCVRSRWIKHRGLVWFFVADADSLDGALKKMATTISKVFRAADIVAEPVRKRTPLRFPRSDGMTVISGYKIVNEVLAA